MRKVIILFALLSILFQTGAVMAAVPNKSSQLNAVPQPDSGCYRILFDETHGIGSDFIAGQYTISDAYSPLADYLRGQGHIVEALQGSALLNTATLDRYDVLVIALPSEYYTVNEKADIATFLVQGGRLVTIAENGQYPGDFRDILNDLHTHLGDGLVHNKDIIEDPTDNLGGVPNRPLIHTFSGDQVNTSVETVLQLYASSLLTGSALDGNAFGDSDTTAVGVTAASQAGIDDGGPDTASNISQVLNPDQINGPIVVQALAPIGSGDVFAIGDANLWDDSDLDSNGKINLEEFDNAKLALNVFAYGKQCTKCRWALFKDRDPWPQSPVLGLSADDQEFPPGYQLDSSGQISPSSLDQEQTQQLTVSKAFTSAASLQVWLDPNEQILENWGIPYTIFHSSDMGAVDLTPYCKAIVASDQLLAFYQALSANRTWFETWINAGGIFEIHGSPVLSESWQGLPMPGNFSMTYFESELVSINDNQHILFKSPNLISDAEIEQWGFSTHGYLVNLPTDSTELVNHDEATEPLAAKFELGSGCVLATMQTLEWGWDHESSRMLENYLYYDNCQANYQLYLSLSLRDAQ